MLEETFGRAMFPSLDHEPSDRIDYPIVMARNSWEVQKAIFVLKLGRYIDKPPADILEKIFQDLANSNLTERIRQWTLENTSDTVFNIDLVRAYREEIGAIALEVFFDVVFERDANKFWSHISRQCSWAYFKSREWQNFIPGTLFGYLGYFTKCNETTKKSHKNKIRKFLQYVLDTPLTTTVADEQISARISDWTEGDRRLLAKALVANGMYEECLEYDMQEAYRHLVTKFLGGEFLETEDGLVSTYTPGKFFSPEEAMSRACYDKEWAHIWSVLTRMAYRSGRAKLIRIIDPDDPMIARGATNAPLKLALRFENSLQTDMHGF